MQHDSGIPVSQSIGQHRGSNGELANLAREIDQMKEEVARLRANTNDDGSQEKSPKNERLRLPASTPYLTLATPPNGPIQPALESPATTLQALHEESQGRASKLPIPANATLPPNLLEFPTLKPLVRPAFERAAESDSSTTLTDASAPRHSSYAEAVASGMTRPKATTLTPKSESKDIEGQREASIARFAQPTKATMRRADETQRKHATGAVSKTLAGQSPKTRTADEPGTHEDLRQPKRNVLPPGWMTGPQAGDLAQALDSKGTNNFAQDRDTHVDEPRRSVPSSPPLRKKKSTLMSPTKATKQRTLATLGHDGAKKTSPRIMMPSRDSAQASTIKLMHGPYSPRKTTNGLRAQQQQVTLNDGAAGLFSGARSAAKKLPAPLPTVENTVTKRRTSNRDILTPIYNRLERVGLLRDDAAPETPSTPHRSSTSSFEERHGAAPTAQAETRQKKTSYSAALNEPYVAAPLGVRGQRSSEISTCVD